MSTRRIAPMLFGVALLAAACARQTAVVSPPIPAASSAAVTPTSSAAPTTILPGPSPMPTGRPTASGKGRGMTVAPGSGPVGTRVVLDGGDCWNSPSDPETYLMFGNEQSDGSGVGIVGSDATGLGMVAMPGNLFHRSYTIPTSLGPYQTTGGGPVLPGTYRFQNLVASCNVTFVVTASTDAASTTACPDVVFMPASSDLATPVLVTGWTARPQRTSSSLCVTAHQRAGPMHGATTIPGTPPWASPVWRARRPSPPEGG